MRCAVSSCTSEGILRKQLDSGLDGAGGQGRRRPRNPSVEASVEPERERRRQFCDALLEPRGRSSVAARSRRTIAIAFKCSSKVREKLCPPVESATK